MLLNLFVLLSFFLLVFPFDTSAQPCSYQTLDFSTLNTVDLSGVSKSTSGVINTNLFYTARVCGSIQSDPSCTADSFCQHTNPTTCTSGVYGVATYNASAIRWSGTASGSNIQMSLHTGQLCGTNPRTGVFKFNCDWDATIPYGGTVVEDPGCTYTMQVYTNLVCVSGVHPVPPQPSFPNCRYTFPGSQVFDFSNLAGTDYYTSDTDGASATQIWSICGPVKDLRCILGTGDPTASACEFPTCNPFNAVKLASYSSSQQFQLTNEADASEGFFVTTTNGANCQGGSGHISPWETQIYMICDATAISPRVEVVDETAGACIETFNVFTYLACGAGQLATHCTAMGYDLTSLSQSEIMASDGSWDYYLKLCGSVSNPRCNVNSLSGESMLCQAGCSNDAYSLAMWAPNQFTWSYGDGSQSNWQTGLMGTMQTGQICGSAQRIVVIKIVCSQYAVTPQYGTIVESPQCTYTMTIASYIVCNAPSSTVPPPAIPPPVVPAAYNNPLAQSGFYYPKNSPYAPWAVYPASNCQGLGYDFSSLSTYDIQGVDSRGNGWWYTIRFCGTVADIGCSIHASPNNTMFCQSTGSNAAAQQCNSFQTYSAAEWDPSKAQWSWVNGVDYRNGVRVFVPGTSGCVNTVRSAYIDFVCDPNRSTAQIATVLESPQCTYRAVVMTNIVCSAPSGSGTSDSLSSGQIAAVVIVTVIVGIICAAICLFCLMSGRRPKSTS